MSDIPFIGRPPMGAPQVRRFDGSGEIFVNTDGIIELCRQIDTPQAKAIYQAFRKHLAQIETSEPGLAPEKQRQKAILSAIKDAGWNVTFIPTPGGAA